VTGCERACLLEQHARPHEPSRKPGGLGRVGQLPCPLLFVDGQAGGPLEGKRGGSEAAPPARPLGRLLQLLNNRRVGLDASRGPVPGAAIRVRLAREHGRQRAMGAPAPGERGGLVDG